MKSLCAATMLLIACGGTSSPKLAEPARESASEAEELRYQVVIGDREAGAMVVRHRGDGYQATYAFNDRGRGPDLTMTVTEGAGGVPTALEVSGNNYLGAEVDERLAIEAGTARWRSDAETGEASATTPAFYVPINGVPAADAALARALLRSPDRELPLYPGGVATIETIESREISHAGKTVKVTLHAVHGLGFSPDYLWLDDRHRFFADGGAEWVVARQGWSPVWDDLFARMNAAKGQRLGKLARQLPVKPARKLAIRDVALFDPRTGKRLSGQTVLVSGDRIEAVGPADQVSVPEGATVVEGNGHTLLPGLWDMHVHIGRDSGLLHLAAGVTTARDLGGDYRELVELREQFDAGELAGPRLHLAGFIDGPGEMTAPTRVVVSTADEARAAVDRYAETGHTQIKIYSSVAPELVPVIAAHAHAKGLRVSGHIPAGMTAREAVEAGYDEIQHMNMLFLNFMPDVEDTRTPARFTEVGKRGANLGLRDPGRDHATHADLGRNDGLRDPGRDHATHADLGRNDEER